MKKFGWFSLVLIILSGCEKDIDFNLDEAPVTMVVDGQIENDRPPVVLLSKSLDLFSQINPEIISNTFIHDAVVTLSNGTTTQQLKEYSFTPLPGLSFFYYTIDSANLATAFVGELNKTYTLNIQSGGKVYEASTTIPLLSKKTDSLWWKKAPFQEDTTRIILMAKTTDPPGLGNYVRYYTQRNNENFWPGENSVFDDQVIDGTTYEVQVQPGIDRNNRVLLKDNFFNRGDSITLKISNIDRATYKFWTTWEFAYQSIGNPFAQPNKVLGNISNGGLGAFCGYASSYKSLVVPR